MNWRQLPNTITVLRLLLAIPLVMLLLRAEYLWALFVMAIAGLSDGLDGWLARRFDWRTRLGGYLDPLADKVLMVSVYLAVAWNGLLPAWLVAVVVAREAVIVSGAAAFHLLTRKLEMAPLMLSKLNTMAQIALVLAVIVDAGVWPLPAQAVQVLLLLVLCTTVASGVAYVVAWSNKTLEWRRHGLD
ncbi:MAG: CDP-alcohol phosphatidyltransferase family protein [Chromatiales bacterium]|nr:CDP-alcohol phosphatidyltransferase family protein [Chromatiales bacterium]MDX9765845.1 CDP-alcohol phosphatidyltransferase family protein [Ectothiorhodospiraceae bacterium]